MEALRYVDVALLAVVSLLLGTLVAMRAYARRRRARLAAGRRRFEDLIAASLVGEAVGRVPSGLDRLERRTLLDAGLAALLELRGRERDRVAALLEEAGLVAGEAAKLLGRWRGKRREAAEVLALIASPGTREPLRAALADPDPLVRLAAARGLVELGDPEASGAVPMIADGGADHHAGAVAELVLALGASAPAMLGGLYAASRSPEVRRIVIAAIGELRLGAHTELLREALTGDDELAARAARGLGMIGDIESTPRLLALVADPERSWFVRAAASTALGQLGDPSAVGALAAELAGDIEWPRRRAAAEALARLGPPGEAALRAALVEPDPDSRQHAAAALDR